MNILPNTKLQIEPTASPNQDHQVFLPLKQLGSIEDLGLGLRWDAATLVREVERRANILAELKIGLGSIVAIAHSGSAHFFADLFAAWQVGAAAACLDDTLTEHELQNILHFCRPAALLVAVARPIGNSSVPVLELVQARPAAARELSGFEPDDPALILFTSGTTGSPKGVVLTFRALFARIALNHDAIGREALASTLVTLPTHFGHGLIGNALTPLMGGGNIVLHRPGIALVQNLRRIVDQHRVTFLSSVPALFAGQVEAGREYFIVDDAVTQGGTFADLRSYIESRGGKVIGSSTLMGAPFSHILAPTRKTIAALREKLPGLEPWWRKTFGHGFDAMTEGELHALHRFNSTDAVRDRIAAAGR